MNDFAMGLALLLALSAAIICQGLIHSNILIVDWQINALSFATAICGYKIGTWIDRHIDLILEERTKNIRGLQSPKIQINVLPQSTITNTNCICKPLMHVNILDFEKDKLVLEISENNKV